MKEITILLIVTITFTTCGSNKNVAQTTITETTPIETTAPTIEVQEIIDEPEIVNPRDEEPIEVEIELETIEETVTEVTKIFNHKPFDALLKEHVSKDGVVNYAGFMKNKTALRDYITSLGEKMPTQDWSKEKKLAYWMNAYNAMTVDLILRNYPLESIKDIDKPWHQRLWKLGDKWYNLDEIEHKILRKMDDPRIHFGINCASFSCPPLLNKAFTSEKVDTQLDVLTKNFINDTSRNTISENAVRVSKIFTWFAKDFKKNGSLIDFLNKYAATAISAKAKVRYEDYNWDLND